MNVIARLEFKIAHFDSAVQRLNHHTTWRFRECGVLLHYHCFQAHSLPERQHLIRSYLWVTQECFEQYWINPGGSTLQSSSSSTATYHSSRHAGHCWRRRDELISDVFLWTPSHGRAKLGRPARTYIQLLCADTGCSPEDLPEAMNDREGWRERVRDIRADSATWWRWWWYSNTWIHLTQARLRMLFTNCVYKSYI